MITTQRERDAIVRIEVGIIERRRLISDRKEKIMASFTNRQHDNYMKRFQCLENATTIENIRGITHDVRIQEMWLEHNIAANELIHLEWVMKYIKQGLR